MMGMGSRKKRRTPPWPNGLPQHSFGGSPHGRTTKGDTCQAQSPNRGTTEIEAGLDPAELSLKNKEKAHGESPSKKKSKGKGKKKVEEKPKHVHYTLEGEPHKKMPTCATRGDKYQAWPAYDNDVQVMQRTLEREYNVSLGRVCQHYKVCLAEDAQARRELGLVVLLGTDVRAYNVQIILRCGTKNAQSTATKRII